MIQIGQPVSRVYFYVMLIDDKGEGVHCLENGKKVVFNTERKAKRYIRRHPESIDRYRVVKRRSADTTYALDHKGR